MPTIFRHTKLYPQWADPDSQFQLPDTCFHIYMKNIGSGNLEVTFRKYTGATGTIHFVLGDGTTKEPQEILMAWREGFDFVAANGGSSAHLIFSAWR